MNAFKPHLASVADYPYTKVDARLKLDQNESPDDLPPELKARALERLAALPWNRYPELHAEDVRAAVARHEGWPEEGVVVAPGSNVLVLALAMAARQVIDTVPAFPYYKGGARAAGTPWRGVPLGAGFALPLAGLLEALDGPPGVLFLPDPHAPTGRLFEAGDVEQLAERARARDALLVVDEAYHAFAGTDARPLARANPNVAILRTFSKSWCPRRRPRRLPARLAAASPSVVARAACRPSASRRTRPPSCSPCSSRPATWRRWSARIRAERGAAVRGALARTRSWRPYPSAANYLLVRTPDAKAAFDEPARRGHAGPAAGSLPGLEGCIRDLVGTPRGERRPARRGGRGALTEGEPARGSGAASRWVSVSPAAVPRDARWPAPARVYDAAHRRSPSMRPRVPALAALALLALAACASSAGPRVPVATTPPPAGSAPDEFKPQGEVQVVGMGVASSSASFDGWRVSGPRVNVARVDAGTWGGHIGDRDLRVQVRPGRITGAGVSIAVERAGEVLENRRRARRGAAAVPDHGAPPARDRRVPHLRDAGHRPGTLRRERPGPPATGAAANLANPPMPQLALALIAATTE